ncbi:hypothetical protein RYX36_026327 [Vicia faba]
MTGLDQKKQEEGIKNTFGNTKWPSDVRLNPQARLSTVAPSVRTPSQSSANTSVHAQAVVTSIDAPDYSASNTANLPNRMTPSRWPFPPRRASIRSFKTADAIG